MDLFDYRGEKILQGKAPLAARMRPKTLEEFRGQQHIVGEGKILRRAIEADRLSSIILYGPPGSGKTALAQVIANSTKAAFVQLNAVTAGVSQIRDTIAEAKSNLGMYGKRTILFIDEIHRFNKAQQDALLPSVESGLIILIGATTENPYFEVNPPLISRSRIFKLEPLSKENIKEIILAAMKDPENGFGSLEIQLEEEAADYLAEAARGDARTALNALELAVLTTSQDRRTIGVDIIRDCVQRPTVIYDKSGDTHYDVISAFIKSLRGSDPDAALHWLSRMLEAGEDPRFICRRMIILASEDIGLADSNALQVAVSAAQALDYVGLPEARLSLAHAAIYLSCAPKSNAVIRGIDAAMSDVREKVIGTVPDHLRDASYKGSGNLGHGKGYLYPHSFPGNHVQQQYLPDKLSGAKYYFPSENGAEKEIKRRLPPKATNPD